MNVLIVGATGFIGSRLGRALAARGHTVAPGSRKDFDFTRLPDSDALRRAVAGFDVVVNAVGILRERGAQSFDALHVRGPIALFEACVAARVPRAIQISALGAEAGALSGYHRSKFAADEHLLGLPIDGCVVRPSLVYGAGGTSAALFDRLASLPMIPLPGGGQQQVQPVHVDDLIDVLVRLVESRAEIRGIVPVVGPEPLSLREFLLGLRGALGAGTAPVLSIPRALTAFVARIGSILPGALLDPETLGMLERGNVGSPDVVERWLGRKPRAVRDFVDATERESRRRAAALLWIEPLLRLSVAAMWFVAGIVSLGLYPVAESLELLVRIGVPARLAPLLLYGAAAVDIAFGVFTLLPRRPRWVWSAQIAIVLVYTAIITVRLPEVWLEPFGPVAKNLPVLVLLLLLQQLEKRR